MQHPQKSAKGPVRVGVLLFDGFSNHCLANAIEPLRAANTLGRGLHYEWRYLSLTGAAATSSSGLRILPDAPLRDGSGDLLLVMPSYGFREFAAGGTSRGLRAAARRFGVVAGLDTGAWLLAQAGLLAGCEATIHWDELTAMAEAFPDLTVVRERFVIAGNRITCSGAMASFDLVLHLIAQVHGMVLALEVEHLFMTRDLTTQVPAVRAGRRLSRAAVALMLAHLERPLSVAEISRRLRCSQRKLEQTVRADLSVTPQRLYQGLRLAEALRLVEKTDMAVSEVALRSGYRDTSAMIRAFRQTFGQTPGQARRGML